MQGKRIISLLDIDFDEDKWLILCPNEFLPVTATNYTRPKPSVFDIARSRIARLKSNSTNEEDSLYQVTRNSLAFKIDSDTKKPIESPMHKYLGHTQKDGSSVGI